MSIVDFLIDESKWKSFLEYKNTKYIKTSEYKVLEDYINNKKYMNICGKIANNNYSFSIPNKKYINKNNSNKKRIVYTYNKEENIILKMMQYLLNEYDYLLCDNCYSFRRTLSSKKAFKYITNHSENKYGYKLDISNYFNSINTDILLKILKNKIDDKDYNFFKKIITNKKVYDRGELIEENIGAIAGCPISCFLSNIYLSELDEYFKDDIYARYADDIIIFDNDIESLNKKKEYIHNFLNTRYLTINKTKEEFIDKNQSFNFLGFNYNKGVISISPHTIYKMKKKLKRKAKRLRMWAGNKEISFDKGAIALINIFNYKFFYEKKNKELNWSIWYFPIINDINGLKEIDHYFESSIRYIIIGKFKNSNKWKVPYSKLKKLGYRSLVNEYYKNKKTTSK